MKSVSLGPLPRQRSVDLLRRWSPPVEARTYAGAMDARRFVNGFAIVALLVWGPLMALAVHPALGIAGFMLAIVILINAALAARNRNGDAGSSHNWHDS